MMMTVSLRKFALTTHVASSVGWLGSVAAFLALAIAGVASQDPQLVRSAYLSMHLFTWFVIVPFSLVGFLTGIVQSLGTPWGLFRHYWVVTKLLLTTVATIILLVHTQPIGRVAAMAAVTTLSTGDLWRLRLQLVGARFRKRCWSIAVGRIIHLHYPAAPDDGDARSHESRGLLLFTPPTMNGRPSACVIRPLLLREC